jgi:hypothetical protein
VGALAFETSKWKSVDFIGMSNKVEKAIGKRCSRAGLKDNVMILRTLCTVCAAGVMSLLATLAGAQRATSVKYQARSDRTAAHRSHDGTIFENVTLISPERGSSLLHTTVVIRDGRVAEIGTRLVAGPNARRKDLLH